MKKINTALGEILADKLGETLCHEHVSIYNPSFYNAFGEKWFPKEQVIKRAVELLITAKNECGLGSIIDGTPIDLGRDAEVIKEVSLKSGVNIILSSGIYASEEVFLHGKRAEELASYFINECLCGIGSSGIKPAILKCATGSNGVTEINEILLKAMAITQKETKLPIYCHNEHNVKTPYAQLKIFEKNGVDYEKVIIGHCSDSRDMVYLEDIAKNGCYLGFDRIYPFAYEKQAQVIAELIAKGYEDKILLSHDYFAFYDFGDKSFEKQKNSDRDFTTVHKKLLPALKSLGVSERVISKLTVDNPRKMLVGK